MPFCPQEYSPQMKVVPCTRCTGWNGQRCTIATGAEQLPGAELIPSCPIQESCQHSIQADYLCSVRKAGYICESALAYVGIENTSEHSLAFNADWLFVALHEQENGLVK